MTFGQFLHNLWFLLISNRKGVKIAERNIFLLLDWKIKRCSVKSPGVHFKPPFSSGLMQQKKSSAGLSLPNLFICDSGRSLQGWLQIVVNMKSLADDFWLMISVELLLHLLLLLLAYQ